MLIAQHKISGTFVPAEDYKWVLLYKLTPQNSEFIERATIDEQGNFEFQLNEKHTAGMYKLVYNVPQDQFNFDLIYNAQEDIVLTFNNNTGIDYLTSNENKLMTSYTKSMGMISQSIGNFYRQQSTDSSALKAIFETLKNTQEEYENSARGTMAAKFIKANRPYLPTDYESVNNYITNIKEHYFDHVDFNEPLLQSSSFLVERVLNYVFGMAGKGNTDTEVYQNNIDEVALAMKDASLETKKMIYHVMWQQLGDANFEATANYITDTYLMTLAIESKDQGMITQLEQFKRMATGQIAPDFRVNVPIEGMMVPKNISSITSAQYYIVVFWSSACPHCLEELPQLQTFMKNFKENEVKVLAFGLEDEDNNWETEITKFPEFYHGIGLGKWENPIGEIYNVTSTPTYFVLDKDKKIVAKPQSLQELVTVFQ